MNAPLRFALIAALAASLAPNAALADLKSEMSAFVVTEDATGTERYVPADSVAPGQTIEYRMVHTNAFDHAIAGVTVLGPVPENSTLDPAYLRSDVPALLEVRGDFDPDRAGEEWSALPAWRTVIAPDGTRTTEEARPEHFTAVRWRLDGAMASAASVTHAYRVTVE